MILVNNLKARKFKDKFFKYCTVVKHMLQK